MQLILVGNHCQLVPVTLSKALSPPSAPQLVEIGAGYEAKIKSLWQVGAASKRLRAREGVHTAMPRTRRPRV